MTLLMALPPSVTVSLKAQQTSSNKQYTASAAICGIATQSEAVLRVSDARLLATKLRVVIVNQKLVRLDASELNTKEVEESRFSYNMNTESLPKVQVGKIVRLLRRGIPIICIVPHLMGRLPGAQLPAK